MWHTAGVRRSNPGDKARPLAGIRDRPVRSTLVWSLLWLRSTRGDRCHLEVGPSKTARGERLCALVKGDSEPCYGSTGKMDSESPKCLLQDVGRDVGPGGVRTAGSAGGLALVRRLQARVALSSEWTARREKRRRHLPASLACSVFRICLVVLICLK